MAHNTKKIDETVLWVTDMGIQPYLRMWELQKAVANARRSDRIPDVLLFTEHDPVFTMGKRGGWKNLQVPQSFLQDKDIPCIATERGGDITYHGPGQLVGYPVLRISGGGRRVRHYVKMLEEAIILALEHFRIQAERVHGRPGVWAGAAKIAFIGLAVQREICFHGFALNVDLDLSPFSWMNPCGLKQAQITSMKDLLKDSPSVKDVRKVVTEVFCSLMNYKPRLVSHEELMHIIQ